MSWLQEKLQRTKHHHLFYIQNSLLVYYCTQMWKNDRDMIESSLLVKSIMNCRYMPQPQHPYNKTNILMSLLEGVPNILMLQKQTHLIPKNIGFFVILQCLAKNIYHCSYNFYAMNNHFLIICLKYFKKFHSKIVESIKR